MDPVSLSARLLDTTRAGDPPAPGDLERLADLDPTTLGASERMAFWLNVYNALVRHGVQGKSGDLRRHRGFFKGTAWKVGGRSTSLHILEHGILRGNRPAPYTLWRPLPADDPRTAWSPPFDARIHFALNCGAVSCPPIRAYTADAIDHQLSVATRSYLNGEVLVEGEKLRLPYLCKLYRRDFPEPRRFVAAFVEPELSAWIASHPKAGIVWGAYHWEIVG